MAGDLASLNWLRYANQGATRSGQVSPQLADVLAKFAPGMGLSVEVFSGGQPSAREGGPRTGSVRHDHGNAADVFFYRDGRRLDWANPQDLPLFEQIVQRGKEAGLTGFGAGPGYMQPGSMHIGFGSPGVWGAGGRGANAPDWLRKAYGGAAGGGSQTAAAQAAFPRSAPSPMQGGAPQPEQPIAPATMMAAGPAQPMPFAPPDAGISPLAALYTQNQRLSKQQIDAERETAEQQRRAALFGDLFGIYG